MWDKAGVPKLHFLKVGGQQGRRGTALRSNMSKLYYLCLNP
jgi:hypothetical protein